MRTIALALVLVMAAQAEDRAAVLAKIATARLGYPAKVKLTDKTTLRGRLLAVSKESIRLQVAGQQGLEDREVPLAEVRSFQELEKSEAAAGFRKGLGGALGVVAAIFVVSLLVGLASR
jgi:hypothetical protein